MWRGRSVRGWLVETGLAVVAAALGLIFLEQPVQERTGPTLWLEPAAGLVAYAGLVLFRRTHPVALSLVLIPFGIVLAMPMGATPIALFAVGLHRRARTAIALTALHAVLITVVYGLALGPTREFAEAVGFLVSLHVSLVAVAMLVRSQRRLVHAWAERARDAEAGQRLRVDQARLGERERLAREMHDVLAHRLSLLAVHAGALEVRRDAPEDEKAAAGVIRQSAHEAIEDLRQVIGMLRGPADDHPQPTLADVPALVEQSRGTGTPVTLTLTDAPVPPAVGRHAYRIVQEALTNARKHAPGAPVRVRVRGDGTDGLSIEVGNRLTESGSIPGAGAGLAGLTERVHLVGGRLDHGPTPAGDFELRAWLPWR